MTCKEALNKAIHIAGGIHEFTRKLDAPSMHAVKQWRASGVPEKYCPKIERITGIRCEEIRPDVEWHVLRCSCSSSLIEGV